MVDNFNLLKKLYKIQAKSGSEDEMINFIVAWIQVNVADVRLRVVNKNIYVIKGHAETYPAIVAHTDQVQAINPNISILEYGDYILGYDFEHKYPAGLGADDKNGIYLALLALLHFDALKAVFFHGEEVGCLGSNSCDLTFFNDARYVVQCDRKGGSDFIIQGITVDLNSEEFSTDCQLEQYGYKECNGGMTDVVTLKRRGLNVACCNLSCGYYNPHTSTETTCKSEVEKCWELVKHILSLPNTYPHQYVPKVDNVTSSNSQYTYNYTGLKHQLVTSENYKDLINAYYARHNNTNDTQQTLDLNSQDFNLRGLIRRTGVTGIKLKECYKIVLKEYPDLKKKDFMRLYKEIFYGR